MEKVKLARNAYEEGRRIGCEETVILRNEYGQCAVLEMEI
jgi:hypothetical protein